MKNLIGVVINAVSGSTTVLIRALNLKLDQDMSISTLRLCKYLEVGDYVNVIAGEHKGDVPWSCMQEYMLVSCFS